MQNVPIGRRKIGIEDLVIADRHQLIIDTPKGIGISASPSSNSDWCVNYPEFSTITAHYFPRETLEGQVIDVYSTGIIDRALKSIGVKPRQRAVLKIIFEAGEDK